MQKKRTKKPQVDAEALKLIYVLAKRCAKQFTFTDHIVDREDLVQVAAMRAVATYSKYDVSLGVKLTTYLCMHMMWDMQGYLRRFQKMPKTKRFCELAQDGADTVWEDKYGHVPGYELELLDEWEGVQHRHRMDPRCWEILRMRFGEGMTQRAVAKALGISAVTVSTMEHLACKVLRIEKFYRRNKK